MFWALINSVLKSLSEELYRVIGDQPICSSNLCWACRIYIIDCASFVLSVLSSWMWLRIDDRCVSVWEAWLFHFSCRRSCASSAPRSGVDTARSLSSWEMRAARYPCAQRARLTAASVAFTTFSAWTLFCAGPAIAESSGLRSDRVRFLSFEDSCGCHKSVHAAPQSRISCEVREAV